MKFYKNCPRKMLALLMPQCELGVKSNAALDSPAVATI
jgi:hypothetical protein